MQTKTVRARGPLRGVIRVPGDKSISHRALLFNAIARGQAVITGLLRSEDVGCTRKAVEALGVSIIEQGDALILCPPESLVEDVGVVDCGNSGTTMRLLCGLLAGADVRATLDGDDSLRRRPMGRVVEPLTQLGAEIDGEQGATRAPLVIRKGASHTGVFDLSVASAQVKSCLFLAGLRSGVRVREPAQSRNHSEILLRAMGADLRQDADGWWVLGPDQALRCVDVVVPGDISSAAFWLVAGAIVPGSDITIERVGVNPTRAGVLDALMRMGAAIERIDVPSPSGEPMADLRVRTSRLSGIEIGGELALRCLDELPVLAIAASFAEGVTVIRDAAELRVKESDRISSVVSGLKQLGVEVEEHPDGMQIVGRGFRGDAHIQAGGDHRIAMAFTVAALAGEGEIRIDGAHSVLTSYPQFFQHVMELTNG